jgi:deoxyribose-phosphate aldolase
LIQSSNTELREILHRVVHRILSGENPGQPLAGAGAIAYPLPSQPFARTRSPLPAGEAPDLEALAEMIDHTLLKPDATPEGIAQLCNEARQYGFGAVCVNPVYVRLCADLLRGNFAKVCTVVGFPLGATPTEVKVFEAQTALHQGAGEIDMVINIGALKAKNYELVTRDIRAVVLVCHSARALVKTIIETSLLDDEEKVAVCLLAKEAGADFVKTSTGFSIGGATVDDVALMRRVVGADMGVKASGGIRTFADMQSMIKAGANRIGASAGVKILQAARDSLASGSPNFA